MSKTLFKNAKWPLFFFVFGALPAAAWCQYFTDGYRRQPTFDVLHYDLNLSFSDTNNVIHGRAQLTILRRVPHDTALSVDFKNMAIAALQVNEKNANYFLRAGGIEVHLPSGGDTLTLAITYAGEPKDGLYIQPNKFNRRTIFADNWPDRARNWFPGIDHPNDKASVAFTITAPARYAVVANGRLEREENNFNGTKTWQWIEHTPIPTYCMVFGAAEFAVLHFDEVENVPVSYYIFPGEADAAIKNFGRTAAMLEFFGKNIGAYPYEKLALVQSSTRFGGMENSSAIFFAESAPTAASAEGTNAHEIAHQWFGDAVTAADWHHLWLSEGFATYFAALFYEHAEGVATLRAKMRQNREEYLKFSRQKLAPILDTTVTRYFDLLNANNYSKAAWVLHMLRQQIGTENFWKGIREYYRLYKNGNALTADLQRVMEAASGENLQWFFQQWLRQPGHPVLRYEWRWLPQAQRLELTLRQIQTGTFFRLPLEVEILSGGVKTRQQVWMETAVARFKLRQEQKPEQVTLDPDEKILMTQ